MGRGTHVSRAPRRSGCCWPWTTLHSRGHEGKRCCGQHSFVRRLHSAGDRKGSPPPSPNINKWVLKNPCEEQETEADDEATWSGSFLPPAV